MLASEDHRAATGRLASLDAYRGLTMLLLAFTAPNWWWRESLAEAVPALTPLLDQFEHVAWRGLVLWDLIQPSFMFMVGVAVPFSIASRRRRGASNRQLWRHAAYRAAALILLGIFLRSLGRDETNWTLEDVVTQIGLGYLPLFWLAGRGDATRTVAFCGLLVGVWALFALWPISDPPSAHAVRHFDGFWAHWNQSEGPGYEWDLWLLNLFPRSEPFVANGGGYYTLNFVPSLATMLLGLLAGERLRRGGPPGEVLGWLFRRGILLIAIGLLLDLGGVCPIVKKLWTPTWVLVSGGLCLLILGALYATIDVRGWRAWAWPAEVVGRNPLAMYVMTWTLAGWVMTNLNTHLGKEFFATPGEAYAPLLGNLAVGTTLWMVCYWMDRNRVYVRL